MTLKSLAINFIISAYFLPVIVITIVWDLFWKAWGLWISSQRKEKIWFVLILIINSAGILPIIYLWLRLWRKKASDKKRKIIRY
ncbi:MAG: DUF5652 family protein [Nanoarchaeota archaeon]